MGGLLAAAVLVAVTVACDDAGVADDVTVPATLAVGTLPRASEPTTPTSAPAAPATPEPVPASFVPGALVATAPPRPWVLVGTGRATAGEPARLAVYTSVDGANWAALDVDAPDHSAATAAVALPDGAVLVAGSIDGGRGERPALWRFADGALGAPELVDAQGVVRAAALTGDGIPLLLLDAPDGPAVAVVAATGTTVTPLPDAVDVAGIAASGDNVIVTGASTWRSIDRGASFQPVDGPELGAVVGSATGFVAAACATGGLAASPDGLIWLDVVPLHPRGVVPTPAGGCMTLAADDEGGVWLAAAGPAPLVFHARDGAVDLLGVPVRPPGTIFAGAPLVAASGATVVAVVPQPGGAAVSVAPKVALTTGLELDASMAAATGVPAGVALPVAVTVLDDRGTVAGIASFPVVTDAVDGSYRWSTSVAAARVGGAGELEPDERAAPIGPDGNVGGIVSIGRREVALGTVVDAELTAGTGGPIGDVVVSRRSGSGGWSPRSVVAGGPGRQAITAVVAAGGRIVGVGEQRAVDPAAGAEQVTPLVVVGDGDTFEPVVVDGGGASSLTSACTLADGTVLAVGVDTVSGAAVAVAIDPATGTATARPGPAGPAPIGCAATPDGVVVAAATALARSRDGVTFEPLDVLRPRDTVTALAGGPSGVAIVGVDATGDGFVLAGPPSAPQRVEAPSLTGVGDHVPTGVVARADGVLVLGLADGAPATWSVAPT